MKENLGSNLRDVILLLRTEVQVLNIVTIKNGNTISETHTLKIDIGDGQSEEMLIHGPIIYAELGQLNSSSSIRVLESGRNILKDQEEMGSIVG